MTKSREEFRKILHYIEANLNWIGEGLYSLEETAITILHGNSTDQQFETLGNCKFLP